MSSVKFKYRKETYKVLIKEKLWDDFSECLLHVPPGHPSTNSICFLPQQRKGKGVLIGVRRHQGIYEELKLYPAVLESCWAHIHRNTCYISLVVH